MELNKIELSQEDIERLTKEAVSGLGGEAIYEAASRYLNLELMLAKSEKQPLTVKEVGLNYSVAGFMAGINFALTNISFEQEDQEEN